MMNCDSCGEGIIGLPYNKGYHLRGAANVGQAGFIADLCDLCYKKS